jgi:A/G-specific adenine glycosylase
MAKLRGSDSSKRFSDRLLQWNTTDNRREMPWKGEKDPYKVWLSEIILQQTRVEQGLKYYYKFITAFPRISDLASASDEKVFKLWEGLGYYSRARNLIATAKTVVNQHGGKFPDTYDAIKNLKGIGPYTAAAISSFAYNLPHAVVDGNVFRIIARIFGIDKPIDSTEGKKYFFAFADELLAREQPGLYNQAIMDFGATVCKPAVPLCETCIFQKTCKAFLNDRVNELPVKQKKTKTRSRWFYYLIINYNDKVALRQRTAKDIWQQLHEFPLVETSQETDHHQIISQAEKSGILNKGTYKIEALSPVFKQQLSHQVIKGRFISVRLKKPNSSQPDWTWSLHTDLSNYAFPRFINQFLEKKCESVLF